MKKAKRFNLLRNAAILLLTVSISLFLFSGCQSKNNQSNANQAATANSNADSNSSNSKRPSSEEMKKRMQDNISSLVTDGTINQTQADKIVEALTANTQRFSGQRKPQKNQQNSEQNNQQNNTQNNGNNGNKQNRQRNNPLSKLVSDGVITQAQADAVMQKIRGNFTHSQSSN